jgi:hypothetical protein
MAVILETPSDAPVEYPRQTDYPVFQQNQIKTAGKNDIFK